MNENLLTKEELAVRLNISAGQVDKLRRDEGLPFVRIGKRYRYNIENVLKWFEKYSKESK